MSGIELLLEVIGLVLFVLAAVNVKIGTLNLVAAGLACWLAAVVLGSL